MQRAVGSASVVVMLAAAACGTAKAPSLTMNGSQGSHIDNGGDVITCVKDQALHDSGKPYFEPGTYTLDYVLGYDPRVGTTEDAPGAWPEQKRRLETLMRTKLPELSESFTEYLDALESGDEGGVRVWKASSMGLSDLDDEDIVQQLADNCKVLRDGRLVPNLVQMVRRRYIVDAAVPKVFYLYDHQRMTELRATLPVQYAYLVTHEWLWDFADGAWSNRSVNRVLQSTATDALSAEKVRQAVRGYGITGDEGGFLGAPSPRYAEMLQHFDDNPLCSSPRRVTVEFMEANGREGLFPGESRDFDIEVPDLKPQIGTQACGFALLYSHKALGSGATLDISLERGPGKIEHTVSSSSGDLRQELLLGTCSDGFCIEREGLLSKLLTFKSFGHSRWRLKLTNRASSPGKVEVVLPYFVFVKMKD